MCACVCVCSQTQVTDRLSSPCCLHIFQPRPNSLLPCPFPSTLWRWLSLGLWPNPGAASPAREPSGTLPCPCCVPTAHQLLLLEVSASVPWAQNTPPSTLISAHRSSLPAPYPFPAQGLHSAAASPNSSPWVSCTNLGFSRCWSTANAYDFQSLALSPEVKGRFSPVSAEFTSTHSRPNLPHACLLLPPTSPSP